MTKLKLFLGWFNRAGFALGSLVTGLWLLDIVSRAPFLAGAVKGFAIWLLVTIGLAVIGTLSDMAESKDPPA